VKLTVHPHSTEATRAAADQLERCLKRDETRNVMVAGGNTPLALYAEVARRNPSLEGIHVFVLDEYVGVPLEHPDTCSNLLRSRVAEAWGLVPERFHALSSLETDAEAAVLDHERRIDDAGGIDLIVLGLGPNGHLGFNEPGSPRDSGARVLDLDLTSIEANRLWFGGAYAPSRGATVGLRTILGARSAILLAFGPAKALAARAMIEGHVSDLCPASFLREHPDATVYLDRDAAALIESP
jgi:glucosamine-6-phosphate deaminase